MKKLALCIVSYILALTAYAQESGSFGKELAAHWESSKALTLAVADAMPDDSYSFKATPAEMSFGGQMIHIAQANGNYCAAAMGAKNPIAKPADETKATAAKVLAQSYDYCIEGLKGMSDSDLQQQVAARHMSKFELFLGGFTHAAHHRGQAEVYLRLKGVTPPSYKF